VIAEPDLLGAANKQPRVRPQEDAWVRAVIATGRSR
jgi:hypothetical protein